MVRFTPSAEYSNAGRPNASLVVVDAVNVVEVVVWAAHTDNPQHTPPKTRKSKDPTINSTSHALPQECKPQIPQANQQQEMNNYGSGATTVILTVN